MSAPGRRTGRKVVAVLFLAAAALLIWALFGPTSTHRTVVHIPPGASGGRIANILAETGVVRSAALFRLAVRMKGSEHLKAGDYTFPAGATAGDIISRLERGPEVTAKRVTFPEGFTVPQTAERASSLPAVKAAEFQRMATEDGRSFNAPFAPPANLEGYLFPDTYEFDLMAGPRDVISRMLTAFNDRVAKPLDGDFRAAARRGYSLRQILVIASLIEREAKVPSERPLVSAVIYNRLKSGMPLQIDATVQFVIGHRERLLYRDLEVDSPYNTYKVAGIPPGPICSPGVPSIEAALRPANVPYLYYTARPDGTHVFTETLQEHSAATRDARSEKQGEGAGGG